MDYVSARSPLSYPASGVATGARRMGDSLHEDGFGFLETDDVQSSEGFRVFFDRLIAVEALPGAGGCTFRWSVENGEVLGGIALRHESAQDVYVLGNMGYGLRPSARGRGLTVAALREGLCLAKCSRMIRVLPACFMNNIPSVKSLGCSGGGIESSRQTVEKSDATRSGSHSVQRSVSAADQAVAVVADLARTTDGCHTPRSGPPR